MIGMLLAAGRGERLEPLSSVVAEPALDVLGSPLLASPLRQLVASGCSRVVVNLHRHPEAVAAAARSAVPSGVGLTFSWEPVLLGSGGGIAAARPLLGDGPVMVANADVWTDLDLSPMAAPSDDEAVLALVDHPDPRRWASVILGGDGRIDRFVPPGVPPRGEPLLFTGYQALGRRVLAGFPEPPCETPPVWEALRRRGALRGVVVNGSWREAGTPEDYRRLVVTRLAGQTWIHPQARVEHGTRLLAAAIGAGCRVDHGTDLEETVVTTGAWIAPGCGLLRCVVAGPCRLAGVGELVDTLVLPSGRFPLAG